MNPSSISFPELPRPRRMIRLALNIGGVRKKIEFIWGNKKNVYHNNITRIHFVKCLTFDPVDAIRKVGVVPPALPPCLKAL